MNVLIDALGVTRKKAGVGVYAKSLIDAMLSLPSGIHFFLLTQDDDADLYYPDRANVTMIRVPSRIFRIIFLCLLFEQIVLPFLLWKHRIQVVHSLHYSFPLLGFGTNRIVTIHDMTSFNMPEVHVKLKVIYFRFFIRAAAARASSIIFVSESARRDCHTFVGTPCGLVETIHHGKPDSFRPDFDPDSIRQVQRKYALPDRFVLYIGTIEPRKNLTALVHAFASVAPSYPDLKLVVAGMKGWKNEFNNLVETIASLKLSSRVLFTGFIAEEDKPLILCAAEVFVYPSLYEGFGLPVLEAMACGVPTITSNTSSLPEVAGEGALLVDPRNAAEIAATLALLLTDVSERDTLRNRAIDQAAKFSWQKAALSTLNAYRTAANTAK